MKKKIIASVLFVLILYSCGQTLYMPSSSNAKEQELLNSGRKLYIDRCSSCHNLHFPKEYDSTAWNEHLDEMQLITEIKDEEKQLIFHYLTSQP